MENCISSPDVNSKDFASAWCKPLCQIQGQITARCLARQIEQADIDEKGKIEMKRGTKRKIEQLNFGIADARQRKVFVQRWAYLENCCDPERIRDMEKALQDKSCSLNDAQLSFSIIRNDLFTEEEKSYIDFIGDDPAVESSLLNDGQHPSCFLGALQKLAIEPIRTELIRCFEPSNQNIGRCLPDKPHIRQLCRSFNRLIRKKKEKDEELLDWLLWIRDVVIPSLNSYQANHGLSVHQLIKFFQDVEGFPLELCRAATTKCRPHQWIDLLAIFAIENLLNQLNEKCRDDEGPAKNSDVIRQLIQWWPSSGAPSSFLHTFYHNIRQEMAGDPLQLMKLVQQVTNQLTTLKLQSLLDDDFDMILDRVSNAPLKDWTSVMRFIQLAVDWTPELALRLTTVLDIQFGQQRTDQFLRLLVHRHPKSENNKMGHLIAHLKNILRKLNRYPWLKNQWIALIDTNVPTESVWQSLSDSETIEREMKISSQVNLSVEDITTIMSRDPETSQVIDSNMAQRMTRIRREYEAKYEGKKYDFTDWTKKIKDQKSNSLQVEDFLAVACGVVQKEKGYVPRDVQLIAVITFVSSDSQKTGQMPRRMGQISTGEGKTLISALVAIYHVLSHWNEDKHVNIITSSSVLAEANISEISWLFKAFGVSVSNNCDQTCSNDDDIRRERYNSDVIYGDLGSFMRDILLTRYFEDKDMTRNRIPGAIIVDEVDSMTLDKGENVLYMSHNIPELYDLMNLFVQIWTLVNAPDVDVRSAESSDIVDEIRQMIEPMIPNCVPNGLKKFSERHLSTWIKSAFRAAYLLQPDDAYKVDDCGDGQGRLIIIMDKETGVEQVETEWSDGLQQFLQLKHGMKWTPISLKAIFMSNIGYFNEFQGRMYGLTGTLGSTAECDLLRQVFGVDFFRLPRFRPRFCVQHEPIIAHDRENWLDQMQKTIISIASSSTEKNRQRSVLVVCDNIESADSIYNHLIKTNAAHQIKVDKYVSSFDVAFKQNQEIPPGQVIIATNLAGRGTDLKPSKELLKNGGLHVIIGFLPPNARVEAQAEGRTARSGQPGSFQFIIEIINDKMSQSGDPYGRMLQLKSKRDDDERLRLDNILRESLPKIQMEEKLFHEFYEKCVHPLKEKSLESLNLFTSSINMDQMQKHIRTIMRNCLNNRWAFWLDENAELIEKAHRDPVVDAKIFKNFEMSVQSSDVESILSSPSEWMVMARLYEESSLPAKAAKYYDKVIEIEPEWCENALLDVARLTLAESAGYEQKMMAKAYLKRARKLIDDRIETLTSLNQEIDQYLNRQTERGSALCHKRFEEQVMNQIRLWRIHSSNIDNLLGVPLKSALAAVLPTVDDQHIDQAIELLCGCDFKPRRYSKKVDINSLIWPSFAIHCREPLKDLMVKKKCNLANFEEAIVKVEQNLWQKLISVYIENGQEYGGGKIIKADQRVHEIPDNVIPKSYQRILPGWLKYHDGQDFSLVSSTLGIVDVDQLKELEKWMNEKNLLKVADRCIRHRILKPIPSMDQDPEIQLVKGVALSSCADVVSAWFSSPIYERNGEQYILPPLFDERKKKLAKQFIGFLIDVGVIKEPAIKLLSLKQDADIHPGQLKSLSKVKSSFCSLHAALPPPSDDHSSLTEEDQKLIIKLLDRHSQCITEKIAKTQREVCHIVEKLGHMNESLIRTSLRSKEPRKLLSVSSLYQLVKCYSDAKNDPWTDEDIKKSCQKVSNYLKINKCKDSYSSWYREQALIWLGKKTNAKNETNKKCREIEIDKEKLNNTTISPSEVIIIYKKNKLKNYIPDPVKNQQEDFTKPNSPAFLLVLYESIKDKQDLLSFPPPGILTMDVPVEIHYETNDNNEMSTVIEVGEIKSSDSGIKNAKLQLRRSLLCFKWLDQLIEQVNASYRLVGNISINGSSSAAQKKTEQEKTKTETLLEEGITFEIKYVEYM